jgi:ParB family chromosome partitioning protein
MNNPNGAVQIAVQTDAEPTTGGFSGLRGLNTDLSRLRKPQAPSDGTPIQIDVALISEDPNQPRTKDNPGFSEESLAELAQAIADRGVKTPISVRRDPEKTGRYIINHGARRLRATKLAKLATVPAFIDQDYNEFDQVVENLHRDALTPREIAEFINRELAKGFKKGEIAKRIGKSNAFVSQHVTLMNLPDPIADAFNNGRVQDVTAINELVKLHKTNAVEVERWLEAPDLSITRKSVQELREVTLGDDQETYSNSGAEQGEAQAESTTERLTPKKQKDVSDKLRKPRLLLKHRGKEARLLYDRRAKNQETAWIRYDEGGKEEIVDLSKIKLLRLIGDN